MNSFSPGPARPAGTSQGDPRRPRDGGLRALRPATPEAECNGTFAGEEGAPQNDLDEVDKLKNTLMAAWNKMKYSWTVKTKSTFSKTSPLYLLGYRYHLDTEEDFRRFQKDFVSRLWFTYRREFQPLEGTPWTTDCGWGCMLRSGQMLLGQGLLLHLLSRAWMCSDELFVSLVEQESQQKNVSPSKSPALELRAPERSRCPRDVCVQLQRAGQADPVKEALHRRILSWFSDHSRAPFGMHQLVALGKSSGKRAGDWYGPSVVAHIIRKAVEGASQVSGLSVYVSQDCTVYKADVERLLGWDMAPCGPSAGSPKAVIILVPVRLGGETLNPIYMDCVKSFHCSSPRKISFSKMDPSCTIGLYARGRQEFQALCAQLGRALNPSSLKDKYPVFTFADGHAQEYGLDDLCPHVSPAPRAGARGKVKRPSTDEFVLL
ncbi:cysteine protease ATG4D isoform X2 [Rhinatrema bivittatum]|uniref:cysteine protease ATG4D isoform X2 n=1 Tax=Rhinatrema bivittatum TaxID=194408 RepID=UPI00112E9CD8|nr:cysteine protease ATG4D isoform X2 [Rhinatrema bivittatum]